jgi:hypothetical protein
MAPGGRHAAARTLARSAGGVDRRLAARVHDEHGRRTPMEHVPRHAAQQEPFDAEGTLIDAATRREIRDLLVALAAWTRRLALSSDEAVAS